LYRGGGSFGSTGVAEMERAGEVADSLCAVADGHACRAPVLEEVTP